MSPPMTDPAFDRLAEILEYERELLQSGRAAEAASLIEEKMEALEDFEASLESGVLANGSLQMRRAAEHIIQLAEENAAHMEAIRNGLRHAITRLEGLTTSAHVGSYSQGGAQISFTNATGTFSRKA